MAHTGDPTVKGKHGTTSSTGGFVQARVSILVLIAAVVLAAVVSIGAAIAADYTPDGDAAALAPHALEAPTVAETATSSTSTSPTTTGSAWSMPPLPEPPTFVSSATDMPPLTRASSASYSPR